MADNNSLNRWQQAAVWLLRLMVGATFIFSGITKAIDPWGFLYKLQDYLAHWGTEWVPREILMVFAAFLAMIEFTAGAMLLLGCMRRASVWIMSALMAVMLPLSLYIWLKNPVDDCGCFGDALVISNFATFAKNVCICLALALLFLWNTRVRCLIVPIWQWLPAAACALYSIIVSFMGYCLQPLIDFRPYPAGTQLAVSHDESDSEPAVSLVYERDGEQREFAVDSLPDDDTWTFVKRIQHGSTASDEALAIYDGEDLVTNYALSPEGPQLILVVAEPKQHSRSRSSMANRLSEYLEAEGGSMIGLLPLEGEALEDWRDKALPIFDIYSVEETQLKELVRGDAALVYLQDGVIQWKRNLFSFPGDFPERGDKHALDLRTEIDDGTAFWWLTALLGAIIVFVFLLQLPWFVKN